MILSGDSSGLPCGSAGKASACNAGDLGSIPGLGRSPGEGKGYPLQYSGLENSIACILHGLHTPWGHRESYTTEWLSLSGNPQLCDSSLWEVYFYANFLFLYIVFTLAHQYIFLCLPANRMAKATCWIILALFLHISTSQVKIGSSSLTVRAGTCWAFMLNQG